MGILELMLQTGINLLPALGVDIGLGLIPNTNEIFHLIHTTRVMILHLLINRATALETIGPRHTVEPQQITLRTGVDVVVDRAVRLAILRCGIGTSMGAVETDAILVGLVIVDRTPLDRGMGLILAGTRTIVVVEGEDVVQTNGHHVVDTGFAASQHHAE